MQPQPSANNEIRKSIVVLAAIVLIIGILAALVLTSVDDSDTVVATRDNPVLDLLGWIPATDDSRRAYAAWSAIPGDPLNPIESLDLLGVEPAPLALGRSREWSRVTGITASQVKGWASSPGAGVTILEGEFNPADIIEALERSGYARTSHNGITIWIAPDEVARSGIIAGDDMRSLAAIALYGDRIVFGVSSDVARDSLDAAIGKRESLAEEPDIQRAVTQWTVGLAVVDQRDLAINCGLGGGWLSSDFSTPSDSEVIITWSRGSIPTTSVRVEFTDDQTALAGQTVLETEWRSGFLNQMGLEAEVSDLTAVQSVYVDGQFVVADLVQGRDNGWTRSGVRFLIGICEHSSRQIPVGSPPRSTPVASPSPVEQP